MTPEQKALYARLPDHMADLRISGRFARLLAEMKAKQEAIERNQ